MRKSLPTRPSVSTTVLAAAACLGTACATTPPPPRPPPPPADCPPGSEETRLRFGLRFNYKHRVALAPVTNFLQYTDSRIITVVNGKPSNSWTLDTWGSLPDGSRLDGEFFFKEGRVDARYTRLTLPTGEVLPICATFYDSLEMKPGSGGDKALVYAFTDVEVVRHFR